jgi:hypothetical protein
MPRDLPIVFYASSVDQADIVAAWLNDQGIKTFVKDRLGAGYPVLIVSPKGVAVCVGNEEDAERAKALLAEHFTESGRQRERSATGAEAAAMCDSCGEVSTFPAGQRGTVQTCSFCGEYVDVPGDDAPV